MLGLPKTFFEGTKPARSLMTADVGTRGLARALVYWHRLPPLPDGSMLDEDVRSPLAVEFDLRTGQLKFVAFQDRHLIDLIGRALRKAK